MIQSMTGYGKTVLQLPTKKITVEIKSLNSKNLDLNIRIPQYYKEKELDIRKSLAKDLERGKIDFSIYVESTSDATQTKINKEVVKSYMNVLADLDTKGAHFLEIAMRLPDALKVEREELDENEWAVISEGIQKAVHKIKKYRADEGSVLLADFKKRIAHIEAFLSQVVTLAPQRIDKVKEKLQKAISDLDAKIDENRFEQELIYYLEKLDITEEKIRLKNHLDYFLSELSSTNSNGKKLGFITQEMGREINTIGSKSNFAPMQKIVVQMKDELEKIKEQNLNVL